MKQRFTCHVCQASYTSKHNVIGHLYRHHGIGSAKKCSCGKQFAWTSEYYLHRKTDCPDVKSESCQSVSPK